MTAEIKTTVLPAGPTKRVWVNKHHLPAYGGTDWQSPVWEVHCEDKRYSGYGVSVKGRSEFIFHPDTGPEGPHAWAVTKAEVVIYTAAEEAA